MSVEAKVAEAILQQPKKITIGSNEYEVAKPTYGTLIEVGKYIATIPGIDIKDKNDVLSAVLSIAPDSEYIPEILAILVLGSKYKPTSKIKILPYPHKVVENKRKILASIITHEMSTKEIFDLMIELLTDLDVNFFLSIIIFLQGIQILKATKKTTVSG